MLIDIHKDARHTKVLLDFVEYCNAHPTYRFWQALTHWSGHKFILFTDRDDIVDNLFLVDPYYFEGKDKQ